MYSYTILKYNFYVLFLQFLLHVLVANISHVLHYNQMIALVSYYHYLIINNVCLTLTIFILYSKYVYFSINNKVLSSHIRNTPTN